MAYETQVAGTGPYVFEEHKLGESVLYKQGARRTLGPSRRLERADHDLDPGRGDQAGPVRGR